MKIYLITPDHPTHSAGVLNMYKHAINLQKNGFDAYVVHFRKQFKKIDWFKFGNDLKHLKVFYLDEMFTITQKGQFVKCNHNFTNEDVIVIPEGFMALFHVFGQQLKVPAKRVLYAQGWSYIVPSIAQAFGGQIVDFTGLGVDHVIAVSNPVKQFVKDFFKYPEEKISIVTNIVNTSLFNTELGEETIEEVIENEDGDLDIQEKTIPKTKKNLITFMPRRGADLNYQHAIMLYRSIGKHKNWEFKAIVNMEAKEVAETLKSSRVFMHYTDGEGFGYPPLEAFLTGNVVVGNKGLGGELFDQFDWFTPSDIKDPYEWVSCINNAIDHIEENDITVFAEEEGKRLGKIYSEKNQIKQLVSVFKSFKE